MVQINRHVSACFGTKCACLGKRRDDSINNIDCTRIYTMLVVPAFSSESIHRTCVHMAFVVLWFETSNHFSCLHSTVCLLQVYCNVSQQSAVLQVAQLASFCLVVPTGEHSVFSKFSVQCWSILTFFLLINTTVNRQLSVPFEKKIVGLKDSRASIVAQY
jgi:hypothetical protein